jgi:hypothetical protein
MDFTLPKRLAIPFTLALAISLQTSVSAQSQKNDVDARIQQLKSKISFGVKQGTIGSDQAQKLRSELQDIGSQAASARQSNGGKLRPRDLSGLDSRLNQQANVIHSYNHAGSRKVVSQRAIGPAWVAGQDGAQDVNKLKRQMKIQERRQLHQEEQAMLQVKEQQQQQYEKEMLEKLGSQRPDILKNKQDIDQIRQNTGAN